MVAGDMVAEEKGKAAAREATVPAWFLSRPGFGASPGPVVPPSPDDERRFDSRGRVVGGLELVAGAGRGFT